MGKVLNIEKVKPRIEAAHGDRIKVDWNTYKGISKPISCECRVCGHRWNSIPRDLIQHKYGCSVCALNARRLSIQEVQQKIEVVHGDTITVDYSGYKNNKTKMPCTCNICGYTWMGSSDMLIHGRGCRKCFEKRKYVTVEQAQDRIKTLYNNKITVDWDSYKTVNTSLKCHCRICGYEWRAHLTQLTKTSGFCPKCVQTASRIPFDEIQHRIDTIHNSTIKIDKEAYTNTYTTLKAFCTECGNSWMTTANSLLSGSGCGGCLSSKYEKRVSHFLSCLEIPYEHNKPIKNCVNLDTGFSLRFDFILPNSKNPKMVIETDGIQHFVNVWGSEDSFCKSCKRDHMKNNFTKNEGILLIRVADVPQKTNKHISMSKLKLLLQEHTINGELDFDALKPYNFNRE